MVIAAFSLTLGMGLMPVAAQVYLMAAQHGTLNVLDDGAFMVLSVAVSAFETRAVADGQLGGSFIRLNMTVPFPKAAFADGKGGLVVGVLEIKRNAQGGFELMPYIRTDPAGDVQPYMKSL